MSCSLLEYWFATSGRCQRVYILLKLLMDGNSVKIFVSKCRESKMKYFNQEVNTVNATVLVKQSKSNQKHSDDTIGFCKFRHVSCTSRVFLVVIMSSGYHHYAVLHWGRLANVLEILEESYNIQGFGYTRLDILNHKITFKHPYNESL